MIGLESQKDAMYALFNIENISKMDLGGMLISLCFQESNRIQMIKNQQYKLMKESLQAIQEICSGIKKKC